MVLVEGDRVEANFFTVTGFIKVVVVIIGRLIPVDLFVGYTEKGSIFQHRLFGNVANRALSKMCYLHDLKTSANQEIIFFTALMNSSLFSISGR